MAVKKKKRTSKSKRRTYGAKSKPRRIKRVKSRRTKGRIGGTKMKTRSQMKKKPSKPKNGKYSKPSIPLKKKG